MNNIKSEHTLEEAEISIFEALKDKFDAPYVRLWSRDYIQIDGDLTIQEMKDIIKIMESIKEKNNG